LFSFGATAHAMATTLKMISAPCRRMIYHAFAFFHEALRQQSKRSKLEMHSVRHTIPKEGLYNDAHRLSWEGRGSGLRIELWACGVLETLLDLVTHELAPK